MQPLPSSPAAQRNRDPILDILRDVLPPAGRVLEIASGGGEHAVHFAAGLPGLSWQPSDPSPEARAIIETRRAEAGLANLKAPIDLDAARPDGWAVTSADAIVCINMIHISPWAATEGLMAGAGRLLESGGVLFVYGPYLEDGVATASSNLAFDASLKSRDPAWGLRRREAVEALAVLNGLVPDRRIEMPANNLSLVFRRL
jgi:SAM-dependent methyltransferase